MNSPAITSQQPPTANRVFERALALLNGGATPNPREQAVSDNVQQALLDPHSEAESWSRLFLRGRFPLRRPAGCHQTLRGRFDNVRANQDCLPRRQAGPTAAVDPTDPQHLLITQNDSRMGPNRCAVDYSFDRGRTWGDLLIPFEHWSLRDGHAPVAATGASITFDTGGNAYVACTVFNPFTAANAVVVAKSNTRFHGMFFHAPDADMPSRPERSVQSGTVASADDPAVFHDQAFVAADRSRASLRRDTLYVTWTQFVLACGPKGTGYCESPIYFSQSTDGATTWSPGIEISGRSTAACHFGNSFDPSILAVRCNFDQDSRMVVGPDGSIYVFYTNRNGINLPVQHLMVRCPGSVDCRIAGNWSPPTRLADVFATQPFAAPQAGCRDGRQCLPPNGYGLNHAGAAAIDPTTGRLYFSWADFRRGGPCAGTERPTAPCANHDNDVFMIASGNGGSTWSVPRQVSVDGDRRAAQWMPTIAVGPDGTVYISYYDRQYGECEKVGCADITLMVSGNQGASFQPWRMTTSALPNLTPANNKFQAGFLGDRIGVVTDVHGAVVVWTDTRPRVGTMPEQDIYLARFPR